MVSISGATFKQIAVVQNAMAMGHEKSSYTVLIYGFLIIIQEIINLQLQELIMQPACL